jgi:hypothetical protein
MYSGQDQTLIGPLGNILGDQSDMYRPRPHRNRSNARELNVSSLNDAAPTPTFQNLNMQPSKIDPFRKMTATSLDRKKLRLPRVPILNCPKNIEPVNWEDGYRLAELNFQMSTMPRSFTPNPRKKTLSELRRDLAISHGRKNMDPQTRSFSDRKNSEIWIEYTQTSHQ